MVHIDEFVVAGMRFSIDDILLAILWVSGLKGMDNVKYVIEGMNESWG